ncbi:hypothetical protein SBA4_3100002 [Candidatus Sulfopaludibacter sp. SbA4]|nr:hypothetical protein SBA4_3100002 [Candidatus Sulfopaludibacter sp. SbA4]
MLTFIQLLEDLADAGRTIRMPASEVDRLVNRFGDRVRQMGRTRVRTAVWKFRLAPYTKRRSSLESTHSRRPWKSSKRNNSPRRSRPLRQLP